MTANPFQLMLSLVLLIGTAAAHSRGDSAGAQGVATSSDGIRISYDVHGSGTPALVLVHGWSCDRGYWAGQVPHFSQAFKVVTIDLAGHGASGTNRDKWTMPAFGADVAAVVEQLDLKRVVLIGHSMGGDVIVEAAKRLRQRVDGLIWVDVYRQIATPRTREQVDAIMAPFRANFAPTTRDFVYSMFRAGADRSLADWVATDMSSAPPVVALGAMESALTFDREIAAALQRLKLPVVAINADYRPTDVKSLQRHGVDVLIMQDSDHFLQMEAPERFNVLLRQAIDSVTRK